MAEGRLGVRKWRMSRPTARPMKAMGKWTAAGWMGFLSGFLGSLGGVVLAGCARCLGRGEEEDERGVPVGVHVCFGYCYWYWLQRCFQVVGE